MRQSLIEVEPPAVHTGAEALRDALQALGISHYFGIIGGGIAAFVEALNSDQNVLIHTRHESGAAFAACEYALASARPAAVFTTFGPGLTNAITGMMAAKACGANVVLITCATPRKIRGRRPIQETTVETLPADLFRPGSVFDYATLVETGEQLQGAITVLAKNLRSAQGYIAHLCIEASVFAAPLEPLHIPSFTLAEPGRPIPGADEIANAMMSARSAIWVGYGCRHAAPLLIEVAERLQCPVLASPRAKGIFPESHPLYLGVSGMGGHRTAAAYLGNRKLDNLLVLGSQLGEMTSYWDPRWLPQRRLYHVDLDPEAFLGAYPHVPTTGIVSDCGHFLAAMLDELRARGVSKSLDTAHWSVPVESLTPRGDEHPVRAEYLYGQIQRVLVEQHDCVVMAEPGAAFSWSSQLLRFQTPGRYRTPMRWASMGHVSAGAIGAAAAGRKVLALVGDGALLMQNEISTAVQYNLPVAWLVLNDGQYGMVKHGMHALGLEVPAGSTTIPLADFATVGRALGAHGITLRTESEVAAGLEQLATCPWPVVIDARIDPNEVAPYMGRIDSLKLQLL